MWEMQVLSLGQEDPLEERTATHSSILDWRIPWTEEPGRLQSMGSHTFRILKICAFALYFHQSGFRSINFADLLKEPAFCSTDFCSFIYIYVRVYMYMYMYVYILYVYILYIFCIYIHICMYILAPFYFIKIQA